MSGVRTVNNSKEYEKRLKAVEKELKIIKDALAEVKRAAREVLRRPNISKTSWAYAKARLDLAESILAEGERSRRAIFYDIF